MSIPEPAKKILVVAPAWVGDMVMSQVLYKLLKERGEVIIDVIAPKHSGPLASRMPEIRKFIELPLGHGVFGLKTRWRIAQTLKAERYDQAIVLPNSWKSALIPWFARIPLRTGWVGECRYGLLNDARKLDKKRYPLMIERFAALAFKPHQTLPANLPWPQLQVEPSAQPGDKPILALCPGAEFGPAKRWPEEYFGEVAKQKLKEGWEVWLFGSPKEAPQAQTIQSLTHNSCRDLVGKTSLAEAIDLMSDATAVISNDSGLMHIAAALGKPLVVMYGSSSPDFTPPLAEKVKVLNLHLSCSPCFQRECPLKHLNCLKQMAPEQVLEALSTLVPSHARTDY